MRVGDEVVLFGKQGENDIPVEDIAEVANSFNYETVCRISRRVPRVYYKDGKDRSCIKLSGRIPKLKRSSMFKKKDEERVEDEILDLVEEGHEAGLYRGRGS